MKNCLLIIPLILLCAHVAFSQGPAKGDIDAFAAQTGALPTIDPGTNSLSFLRFPAGRAFQVTGGDVQQKSTGFVNQNSNLFGIRAGQDAYRLRAQSTDNYGLDNVTLQQTYKGVPVFEGMMKFHYNKNKELTAMNGNYISDIEVNVVPTLAQQEAETLALQYVGATKMGGFLAPLKVKNSTIYIFQKGLVQGVNGAKLLVYEVEVNNDADVREFLYIDAHNGSLIEQFTGIHQALHRTLYETSQTLPNRIWDEGDAFPGTLDSWQQSEVATSGFMYNMMKNAFGFVSYDNADAIMVTINNNPNVNCPNATWNGVSANYCTGMATDDVVAHEWAHAYTQYTNNLIYQWQPGALNEAYSDIWGETVDQIDSYMDEGESDAIRTGCGDGSNRWQIGEKLTAFPGANRDMWNPNCFGDPGKVTDPQYHCRTTDNGGVHHNSGVINHAYALLVDGGSYNGQNITGLGLTKAAHIFWLAQSQYMIATTDFAAQADILEAAATALIGINLPALSTANGGPTSSGQIISAADVTELGKVIAAVELRAENNCQFTTILGPAPALCEGANAGLALFYENFEGGLGAFTTSFETSSASWVARSWVSAPAPAGRAGNVAFGIDYQGGDCAASLQAGIIRIQSPVINIPAGTAGNLNMAFDHFIAIQDTWDGGNIKYSIDGGTWTLLPAIAFTANAYNNVLNTSGAGSTNPMQGQQAFTGTDNGSVTGSWGQSQVDLTSIGLTAGHTIQFRFELGTNNCTGIDGWYVDDFRVYTCAVTPAVHFAMENATINEGEGTTPATCLDYVDKIVTVQIDKAPTQPVTITFNAPGGTAKNGANGDFTIFPASVNLASGSLTQNVTLRIYNDAYVEGPETIDLGYSINANGGNGYAASSFQNYQLTIIDDDLTPGNYTEELLNSNFDSGQQGWKVINGGNSFHGWAISQYSNAGLDALKTPFFFVQSNITNGNFYFFDDIVESPPINTEGKKNIKLIFSQAWLPQGGSFAEQGLVDVWDGTTWQNLLTQNEATGQRGDLLTMTPDIQQLNIPDAYANVNMKVRFRYISNSEIWWAIDLVKVTATNSTQIASAVNIGNAAQEYLGPNETAVFYDPATGNLMAKIKNLSAHDYGCTTVEVDRAGNNGTPWLGTYQVSNKTYKVTPTNNNPAGQYEITVYYKASELATFTPAAIQSMGKSAGSIATGDAGSTALVAVDVSPAFNGDYAFTSTFSTGFSGFGLSDAPPGSALPVTLVKFDGKHTAEGNQLKWTTTSETDNAYFAVEESLNGRTFTESGRVQGMGTSAVTNEYSFTDTDFSKGVTYYRLKQVDTDGKFAYSRIIAIDALRAGNVKFYPNPVQSSLAIELPGSNAQWVNARVINTAGQEVLSREKLSVKNGKLNLNLGKLPSGIYQVIISGEKVNHQLSVFKL